MTPEERDILTRVDTTLGNLCKELLGDGQPGRIRTIETRVGGLENSQAKAKGWAAGVAAMGAFVWGALEWLLHRGK